MHGFSGEAHESFGKMPELLMNEKQLDGSVRISHSVIIQADDGEEFEFDDVSLQGKLRSALKPLHDNKRWPKVLQNR